MNVSHELRTPVTIARGPSRAARAAPRREDPRAVRRLRRARTHASASSTGSCCSHGLERADWIERRPIGLVSFLEDVFMRWAEVAPRAWRLGSIVDVTLDADETWLRAALDAILENAVHHTEPYAAIDLSARGDANDVVIVVTDGGDGIPPASLDQIFERFARTDDSRSRREGRCRARPGHRGGDRPRPRRLVLGAQRDGRQVPRSSCACPSNRRPGRTSSEPRARSSPHGRKPGSNLLESTGGRALPQVPSPDLPGGRRAGGGGADAHERDRAGQDPPGLPVRRPARHREDVARAHPRQGAQLRAAGRPRRRTTPATRASRSRAARRST